MDLPEIYGPVIDRVWKDGRLCNVYKDPYAEDEFSAFVDYCYPVLTLSQDNMEQERLHHELEDTTDYELLDVHTVLRQSQENEAGAVDDLLDAVTEQLGERLDRAERASTSPQAPKTTSARWGARKHNSVVQNANTLKANKSAVKAFTSWLQEQGINTPVEDMDRNLLVKHLAEYVLVMRRQDGEEYKREALISNINGVMRHFNTVNADRHLRCNKDGIFKKIVIADYPPLLNKWTPPASTYTRSARAPQTSSLVSTRTSTAVWYAM